MTRHLALLASATLLAGCTPGYVRDARDLDLRVGLVRGEGPWPGGVDPVELFTWYEGEPVAKFASVAVRPAMDKVAACDLMIQILCEGTEPDSSLLFHVHSAYTGERLQTFSTTLEQQRKSGPGGMALQVLAAFKEGSELRSKILAHKAACPPSHLREPATLRLFINDTVWRFRPHTIEEDQGNQMVAYYVTLDGKAPGHYAILRRGAALTGIQHFPDGRTVATIAAQGPPAEIFWQAVRSLACEAQGDALAAKKGAAIEDRVSAAAAWERGWNPDVPNPSLLRKVARVYGELLRSPAAPSGLAPYVTAALLRLPAGIEGTTAEREEYALARSCALFGARCWPRLEESLKEAGKGPDAEGMREAVRVLGTQTFMRVSEPAFVDDRFALSSWTCSSTPAGVDLPRLEHCVMAESSDRTACFTLTRYALGGKIRYVLELAGEVIDSYGEQAPTLPVLHARIASELALWKHPPAAAPDLQGLALSGGTATGQVIVDWTSDFSTATLELRAPGLVAVAWVPALKKGQIRWPALPAGSYEGRFRTASGDIDRTWRFAVGPEAIQLIALDLFERRTK